jgi:hypothetical protein
MAKTYLAAKDPKLITRTWADVMERFCKRDKKPTRIRHERVVRTKLIPASEIERFLKDTLE